MIIDKSLEFSDAQSLTADAASTNVIDLGANQQIGPGEPMNIVVTLGADMGGTSPTMAVQVQTDSDAGFGSATTVQTSRTLTSGSAGDAIVMGLPDTNERYLRLYYDLGGTSPTATVSASIVKDAQQWAAKADAV